MTSAGPKPGEPSGIDWPRDTLAARSRLIVDLSEIGIAVEEGEFPERDAPLP